MNGLILFIFLLTLLALNSKRFVSFFREFFLDS